nr:hypothetical protein [Deinococcus roseus]
MPANPELHNSTDPVSIPLSPSKTIDRGPKRSTRRPAGRPISAETRGPQDITSPTRRASSDNPAER